MRRIYGPLLTAAAMASASCLGGLPHTPSAVAGDDESINGVDAASPMARSKAIERALVVLERGARNYPRHRSCFACHHQTFPLLAQTTARPAGLRIDEPTFKLSAQHTVVWFESQRERLAAGRRIDGQAITVAYGLWTLELANRPPDQLSDALVANLLAIQRADGAWEPEAHRPPAEESRLFVTALSLRGLQRFARDEHVMPSRQATAQAFAWVHFASPESLDDHAGKLLAHVWSTDPTRSPDERLALLVSLRARLLSLQQEDDGWAQRAGMASDAYATGLALWALAESGASTRSPPYLRGATWLVKSQRTDGSWRVTSRCEPVQTYFDNGDPHGEDQFLSMMATGWAAAALAR